jgi:GTP:adenosylcobinamide-phosphate guanylyltransferase
MNKYYLTESAIHYAVGFLQRYDDKYPTKKHAETLKELRALSNLLLENGSIPFPCQCYSAQIYEMINYLCVIQARLGSSRFPGKVMQTVGGKPMVKRVWEAAKGSMANKVVVLWPERNPDVPETNLLTPFRRLNEEFKPINIIRLTADCPLITTGVINEAILYFEKYHCSYFNNRKDGFDVQIFCSYVLFNSKAVSVEHVIKDRPNVGGLSVNTPEDLERVRAYAR